MRTHDQRWNAEDPSAELDKLESPRDASRGDHDAWRPHHSSTTSIPVSQDADVQVAQRTARRMGRICRLPDERLGDLAILVGELAGGIVRDGGGFLRVTPVPGAGHLGVLVEAEGPRGQTRCLVDVAAPTGAPVAGTPS